MRQFSFYTGLVITALIFSNCAEQKKVVHQQNQSSIYNPSTVIIRPEYSIFNNSDTTTQILTKIYLDEFLFNQANPEGVLRATVKMLFQLTDITKDSANNVIADSVSFVRNLDRIQGRKYAVLGSQLKASLGKVYRLRIVATDVVKEISVQTFFTIDKRTHFSAQNFKVVDGATNTPLFRGYVNTGEAIKFYLNNGIRANKLYVSFQKTQFHAPPPPFSSQTEPAYTFKADTTWVYDYNPDKKYAFPFEGTYLVKTDSLQTDGLILSNFGDDYPRLKHAKKMLAPLEYLTTTDEFKKINGVTNQKVALDNFWLRTSDNTDIGREMIRVYYTRLYYANLYFTSYKQGWQTDRGMIYAIFGPPSYIRKTENSETWQYYVRQNATNLTLVFLRVDSPYSDNNFTLVRNESFTSFWRDAVNSWRSGKVYSLEE